MFVPQHTEYLSNILFGPSLSRRVNMDHIFLIISKILPGKKACSKFGIKGGKALRLNVILAGLVSIRVFCLFSALGTENFVALK